MNVRSISEVLSDLNAGLDKDRVSLDHVLESLHERGFGFLLLVFALPAAVPVPGFNMIFAALLLLLTVQMALGRHTIWLPEKMRRKTVSAAGLKAILAAALPWLRRAEVFVRPRLGLVTQGAASRLAGACGVLMAAVACLPVPLTHTVPSIGLALLGVGVVTRDGLAVLGGIALGLAWIALLALAIVFVGGRGMEVLF